MVTTQVGVSPVGRTNAPVVVPPKPNRPVAVSVSWLPLAANCAFQLYVTVIPVGIVNASRPVYVPSAVYPPCQVQKSSRQLGGAVPMVNVTGSDSGLEV